MKEKHHLHLNIYSKPLENWQTLESAFNGNIYHSSTWAEICLTENSRPVYFVWSTNSNEVVAIAIGICRWSKAPLIGRHLKRLNFETYPALAEGYENIAPYILETLLRYARSNGYLDVEVGSYMSEYVITNIEKIGFQVHSRLEFSLQLDQSDDALLKQFSTTHRRKLKKAQKHGLVLKEAATIEAIKDFRKLQVASRDRRVKRGENIGMHEGQHFEYLVKEYFKRNLGVVFLVLHNNSPVSGAFVSIHNGKAFYVFGGSSDEGFKMNAPAFLFWNIFSICREKECKIFNLGGVPLAAKEDSHPSHGLYRFKAGFGGQQEVCVNGSATNLRPVLNWMRMSSKKIIQYISNC